ncbi:Phospholipase D-like domain containing protein [Candidatus Nanopelagicaceae bacterium]
MDWQDLSMQGITKKVVINNLIDHGVDVRYLPRLHAKVIVSDWDRAVIGSQNFTYYSQGSYEISFELDRFEEGADLDEVFETLNEWWDSAGEDEDDYDDDDE